ncbi:MAG: TolC family protein [Deltaproteobacteria bacterium]|nr:TolC family protein [Deltaproteobacteria bacterium]
MSDRARGRAALWLLSLLASACASGGAIVRQALPPRLQVDFSLEGPAEPGAAGDGQGLWQGTGPIELTVEAAVLGALAHNRDLQVRRLTPEIQDAFAEIARGRYDPELFAGVQAGHERSVEVARSTGALFDVEGTELTSEVGVRQAFSTGTQAELSLSHSYSDSSRTPAQQRSRIGLSLTQALLRGLGPSVNLAAIEQADLEVQASRYELRGYAEALVAEAEIAYWRYVLALREIAIYEESLKLAQKQQQEIEQEIEVGTMAQTESAAACAEVAVRRQDLIDARSLVEQRRLRLLRLLGADLARPVAAVSEPTIEPAPIEDLDERLALAQRSRAEINEAALHLEERRLETVVTRDGLLPRLDVFVQLGKTGFAGDFGGSFRNLGEDKFDLLGGLSFSALLRNREAEGSHRGAVAAHRQAKLAVANLRQLVALEVRLAADEVERARQQIAASAATRVLQEKKVQVEQERFRVGESTALMLAQAQRDQLSSRIAEIRALVDYRAAMVQLCLAEGSLLERRGIRLGR